MAKLNLNIPVKDPMGEEVVRDGKPVIVADLLYDRLLTPIQSRPSAQGVQPLHPNVKQGEMWNRNSRLQKLARKIARAQEDKKDCLLETEEITLIKEHCGPLFSPMVVGFIDDVLEGRIKEQENVVEEEIK